MEPVDTHPDIRSHLHGLKINLEATPQWSNLTEKEQEALLKKLAGVEELATHVEAILSMEQVEILGEKFFFLLGQEYFVATDVKGYNSSTKITQNPFLSERLGLDRENSFFLTDYQGKIVFLEQDGNFYVVQTIKTVQYGESETFRIIKIQPKWKKEFSEKIGSKDFFQDDEINQEVRLEEMKYVSSGDLIDKDIALFTANEKKRKHLNYRDRLKELIPIKI